MQFLISIFIMTKDVDNFIMCLLACCPSSFEKCLLNLLIPLFVLQLFNFILLSLCNIDVNSMLDKDMVQTFFTLLSISFAVQMLFNFRQSNLDILPPFLLCYWIPIQKACASTCTLFPLTVLEFFVLIGITDIVLGMQLSTASLEEHVSSDDQFPSAKHQIFEKQTLFPLCDLRDVPLHCLKYHFIHTKFLVGHPFQINFFYMWVVI